jgi:hypothetical protein
VAVRGLLKKYIFGLLKKTAKMKKNHLKLLCFTPLLLMGICVSAQVGQTNTPINSQKQNNSVQTQQVKKDWLLLETKDGVSCYWKINNMGTGNGVFLRFVNNAGGNVTVNWSVVSATDIQKTGKIALAEGQVAESNHQSADSELLAVRITSDQPVISFTVSK